MDEIILRSLKRRTTPAEESTLAEWRAASSENERHYQELAAILEASTRPSRPSASPPPVERMLAAARHRETERTLAFPIGRPSRVRRWWPRVAAAIALPLLGFGASRLLAPDALEPFQPVQIATARGETATVHANDGTVIHLAPESRLDFPRGFGVREVTLTGRAYFSVAKKNGEPFYVHSSSGEVKVLGTRFDLSAADTDLRLIVVEGRVALSASGREVEVNGGEMTRVVDGSEPSVVSVGDMREVLDWEDDFLAFRDTPLPQVAHELEEHYGISVQVTDSALAHQTVTAWFSDRTADEVLTVICSVIKARCLIQDDKATIAR